MARMLSLLPCDRTEPITAGLLRRAFLSRPRLLDRADSVSSAGCGAGLCSIEAQVEPRAGQVGTNSGMIALRVDHYLGGDGPTASTQSKEQRSVMGLQPHERCQLGETLCRIARLGAADKAHRDPTRIPKAIRGFN
jgi:hypothetical protein